MKRTIFPAESLSGRLTVPASKSHTIRALLIAAMADGTSRIINPLESSDARSCVEAVRVLGAEVETGPGEWRVQGSGGKIESGTVDVGNSGTTLYLAAGLAALGSSPVRFTGDEQIRARPAGNLLFSLADLGAEISWEGKQGYPPFTVAGPLTGGSTRIECPTSQYLSSLLLCSPLADGNTDIAVPLLREQPYVEMTLRWLDEQFTSYSNDNFKKFFIPGGQRYRPFTKQMPGDFSSASFFLCAAAVTGSELVLDGLDMTDSQGDKKLVGFLEEMGCQVETGEAFVRIKGGSLTGSEFDLNDTPDALPVLAVTACYARGETRLVNVPQARLKETDRIAVMRQELSKLGADATELPDGLVIKGGSGLKGGEVSGHKDHRVIMALAVAALGAESPVTIDDSSAAAITFPDFFELLEELIEK